MLDMLKKLFGAHRPKSRTVTVVSGLPRSGTSLMMQMLEAGGMPTLTDGQRGRDADNPKGYYEFQRVKKLNQGDTAWLPQAQGKAVKVVSALLPYLPPDYAYRVLFMRRRMEEVLASQDKMLDRRGADGKVDDGEMEKMYRKHLRDTEEWLRRLDRSEHIDVDFNGVVDEPEPVARRVAAFLDRDLDLKAMASVVDPELYRNRA